MEEKGESPMAIRTDMRSTKSSAQRAVKLRCPSLFKAALFTIWEDEKIDVGCIARAFGLDPSTVMLNGHFISRGVDFIAYSVTWKSLLSFFSAKGFSTGANEEDALVVDGKLDKVGKKRGCDPVEVLDRSIGGKEKQDVGCSTGTQVEDINFSISKRLRDVKSGDSDSARGLCSKRKQLLEDFSLFKKLKINDENPESPEKLDDLSKSAVSQTPLSCSYIMSKNMKRIREHDAILASRSKRIYR